MERWFTTVQGSDIAVTPTDFTDVEKAALAAILQYANDSSNKDRELMYCLDIDGTKVIDFSEGYKSAEVTEKMRCAMTMGCVRLWHNHPSGGSLSDADWELAGCSERTEILAVTASETFYVGRMMEWPDCIDAVMRGNFRRLAGDLDCVLQAHTLANQVFDERLQSAHLDGHILNLSLAECGVVRYSALLSPRDAVALDGAEAAGLLAKGRAWAANQIRCSLRPRPPPTSA